MGMWFLEIGCDVKDVRLSAETNDFFVVPET